MVGRSRAKTGMIVKASIWSGCSADSAIEAFGSSAGVPCPPNRRRGGLGATGNAGGTLSWNSPGMRRRSWLVIS